MDKIGGEDSSKVELGSESNNISSLVFDDKFILPSSADPLVEKHILLAKSVFMVNIFYIPTFQKINCRVSGAYCNSVNWG